MTEEEVFDTPEVEASYIKCENCGANMVFEPNVQALCCPHCETTKAIESSLASELDLLSGLAEGNKWEEKNVSSFQCENCGAKVVFNINETSKACPFCGTSHVQELHELIGLKPNGVIPFSFDDEKALLFSKAWAKKKFFAPSKFKKKLSANNVKGMYTPCFTFDSRTISCYDGRIGQTRTRTVGSGKNKRVQVYTVWRNISGTLDYSFDDVLVTAGSKLSQEQLDKIAPFDTNNGKTYEEDFLLGYSAYQHDSELSECWSSARGRIDQSIRTQILSRYVYDKVAYLNVHTRHEGVTYKYVMLPVYIGNFNYKKKLYNFYVNGSTGKVFGKYPKSVLKILLTILIGFLGLALIIFLINFFG